VTRRLAVAVALATFAAGCGGAPSDKAGGARGAVRVLRLANANTVPGPLAAYADEVERESDGRLRIAFINDYRREVNDADAEPGIIADVRAGKIDLAWVGARALKAQGVSELDPLIAPFAVTDYNTEQRVLLGPLAHTMLDAVDRIGVRAVALLPGPLFRLAMRTPWSGPGDLAGKRIGAPAGIGSDAIRALGAVPVVRGSGHALTGLDGDQQPLPSFYSNGYMRQIPYVASQPFWPRPYVVIASPALWRRLDARDRESLLKAGTAARAPVLDSARAEDSAALPKLCRAGARFSEADLAALRRAVDPVYAGLRADATTAPILAAIERLPKGRSAPLACPRTPPPAAGEIPPGEYTFTLTEADKRRRPAGRAWHDALPQRFRVEITPGHMVLWVTRPGETEEISVEGDFSTYRDRMDFNGDFTARWELDADGSLRFSDVRTGGGEDDFIFATRPWTRVR
jgi:TRAP-type C4-dicarboxylate transport system substrate-binding protein